ncbi:MAG: extracellular solute-binding protein [Candidatus Dormiibacterota bacterium]
MSAKKQSTADGTKPRDRSRSVSRRRFLELAGAGGLGLTAFPTILTACGGGGGGSSPSSGKSSGPGEISLFIGKDTSYPNQQAAVIGMVQAEFQKQHPGSKLTWDTYASSDEELTKVETSAASHSGPDIFEFGTTLVPTAYATGAFEVITDDLWNQLGGKSAFIQSMLTMSGPSKDKLIAIPETAAPYAMVYNKKLLADAGVSKPPTTWTEFVDTGQKVSKADQGVWGAAPAYNDSFEPWHHIWMFTAQLGGNMVSPDGKKAQLNSPEVLEAAAFWLDWAGKYKIASKADATFKGADRLKAFANGKAAFLPMMDQSGIVTFDQSVVANQYAYAPNPTVPYGKSSMPSGGKPVQGFVSGQLLTIFKYSKHKDLALDAIKILVSPEIQYQQWKQRSQLPVSLDVFKKYSALQTPLWNIFVNAEKQAYPIPFIGAWGQLEVVLGRAINQISSQIAINGSYSMSDLRNALQQANTQLQSALAQH